MSTGPDRSALVPLRLAVRRALADLPGADLVLVACSGGPDSVALAAAVAAEAARTGRAAGAVVVDHGLQPGSATVAARAAALAADLGLDPVVMRRVQVGAAPGEGGPEAAARAARYAALGAVAADTGAAAVLLGHTRDDQAETVLLGLARGSGARSLAGMAARAGIYRRPLLALSRDEVRAAAAGLDTVDDPHNADARFARARVRHDVLPGLEAALGPGVGAALARTAALLRADADALDAWASREYAALNDDDPAGPGLSVDDLGRLPEAVRTRVLRLAALAAGVPPGRLTRAHVVAVERLALDPRTTGPVSLPSGVEAHRGCGRLRLRRPGAAPPPDPRLE